MCVCICDLHHMNLTNYFHSINVAACDGSSSVFTLIEAIRFVIKRENNTGRRSVIAISLIGPRSDNFNNAVEEAVKENIVMVTAAGKKQLFLIVNIFCEHACYKYAVCV